MSTNQSAPTATDSEDELLAGVNVHPDANEKWITDLKALRRKGKPLINSTCKRLKDLIENPSLAGEGRREKATRKRGDRW